MGSAKVTCGLGRGPAGVDGIEVAEACLALGTPVVGVFGPSDYARARPWGTVHRVVRVDTTMFEGELRADDLARMDRALARITAQQVTHAAEEVIRITTP